MSGKLDALDELLASIPTLRCPHCDRRDKFNYVLPQRAIYTVIEVIGTSLNVSSDQADLIEQDNEAELFCLSCKTSFKLPEGFSIDWDRDAEDDEEET
jgi:hypothetical protein